MKALQPTPQRDFWVGLVIGLAFRFFAYGILISTSSLPLFSHSSLSFAVGIIGIVTFFAPFWVPFAGGFISAYFWLPLQGSDYMHAITWTALLLLGVFTVILFRLGFPILIGFLCALAYVDAGMCRSGFEQGRKFWNSRLSREFLGDFSARDEEKTFHDLL